MDWNLSFQYPWKIRAIGNKCGSDQDSSMKRNKLKQSGLRSLPKTKTIILSEGSILYII